MERVGCELEREQNLSAPDKKVVEMVENALVSIKTNTNYYNALMEKVKNREDREVVRQMMLDGLRHEKMLAQIYRQIVGRESICVAEKREADEELTAEFKMNIFSEGEESECLRVLYSTFLNLEIRDMLQEIIWDKQNHTTKFSYLYAKYSV